MVLVSIKFNIHFRAKHVRGRDNRSGGFPFSTAGADVLPVGTMGRPDAHHSAQGNLAPQFCATLNTIVRRAMAQSTWKTCRIAVKHFTQFLQWAGMPCSLPVPALHIAFFVSSLFDQGCASSTMATHLSAIACVHKLNGFPDPTSTFLIQKAMQGARKSHGKADTRLPITFDILCKLVNALTLAGGSAWDQVMYRSMFFLAFFALARIGELCISAKHIDNVLTMSSLVQIKGSDNLRVIFMNYKHSSQLVGVTVAAQASSYCPVRE